MDNINNGLGGHPVQVCFKCGRICINHRHLDLAGAPDEKEIQAINKKIVDENLESHFIRKLNFKGFPSFSPLYKFLTYKTFLDKGDTRYQCGGREEMIARAWIIYTNVKSSEVGGLSLSFDPTSTNPDNVERIEVASLKADDNSNQTILKEYIFSKIYPGKTKANINPPEKKINNATNAEVNFNTLSPNEQEAITQKAIKNAANQLAAAEAVAAGECAANVANVENQVARGGVFGEVDFFTSEKPLNLEKISYKLSKIRGTGNFPAFNESDDTIEAEIRLILELGRVSRTASGGSKKKQRKTNKRKTNKRKTSRRRTK